MDKRCFIILFALAFLGGCNSGGSGEQRTISVIGLGTVIAEPDMAEIEVTVSHTAQNAREAQEEVNRQTSRVLELADGAGIKQSDVKTSALTVSPEMEYMDGRQKYTGQKSELSVHITINDIKTNPGKLPEFIYSLTEFDKIILRNIRFDVKDKTALFAESRELAYNKALDKAVQYAELSGGKITKTLGIAESGSGYSPFSGVMNTGFSTGPRQPLPMAAYEEGVNIPAGSIEVSSMIEARFLFE